MGNDFATEALTTPESVRHWADCRPTLPWDNYFPLARDLGSIAQPQDWHISGFRVIRN